MDTFPVDSRFRAGTSCRQTQELTHSLSFSGNHYVFSLHFIAPLRKLRKYTSNHCVTLGFLWQKQDVCTQTLTNGSCKVIPRLCLRPGFNTCQAPLFSEHPRNSKQNLPSNFHSFIDVASSLDPLDPKTLRTVSHEKRCISVLGSDVEVDYAQVCRHKLPVHQITDICGYIVSYITHDRVP